MRKGDRHHGARRTFLKSAAGAAGTLGLAGCLGGLPGTGSGKEYPSEDIFWRIVGSQGGGTDSYARAYGQKASKELGVNFQYQAGFSTILPVVSKMFNAKPNGYNMMAMNLPSGPLAWLLNKPEWDLRNLVPICIYGLSPIGIFARKDLGIKNLGDLLQRYRDGELKKVGSQSVHTEVILQLLKSRSDFDWQWENLIRYGGGTPTMKAIIQGEIPVGLTSDSAVASGSAAAKFDVQPVVILHSVGSNVLPDTPTLPGEGYPKIDFIGALQRAQWFPPETPTEKRDVIEGAFETAYESNTLKQWSKETGRRISWTGHEGTGEALRKILKTVPKNVDMEGLKR